MELGVFNDGLGHLSRRAACEWCADHGIRHFELGVGGWRRADHIDLDGALRERSVRADLLRDLADFDLSLSCVNGAGNPLHPDASIGPRHAELLRGAVELAALLGVDRVVTMSGCPGGPGGGNLPIFAPWALNPDCEKLWEWQWEHRVAPFWRDFAERIRADAPDVRVCIELHAGALIYNPASFAQLAAVGGDRVGLNFDPSHFWWMGIDPLEVIAEAGDRVYWCHAKDTVIREDRVRKNGVFDFRHPDSPSPQSWSFTSVGSGHGAEHWAHLLASLAAAGYTGPASVEYEHTGPGDAASREAGLARSVVALQQILDDGGARST